MPLSLQPDSATSGFPLRWVLAEAGVMSRRLRDERAADRGAARWAQRDRRRPGRRDRNLEPGSTDDPADKHCQAYVLCSSNRVARWRSTLRLPDLGESDQSEAMALPWVWFEASPIRSPSGSFRAIPAVSCIPAGHSPAGGGSVYDLSPWGPAGEVEDLAELVLGVGGFGEHPAGFGAASGAGVDQHGLFDPGELLEEGSD